MSAGSDTATTWECMGISGINHIAFRTPDPERLTTFYIDLLGAEPLARTTPLVTPQRMRRALLPQSGAYRRPRPTSYC